MSTLTAHAGAHLRCTPFKAGALRLARHAQRPLCQRTLATAEKQCEAYNPPGRPTSERHPVSLGRIEAAAVALLASSVVAGGCLAADSPDSAAQAVQAAKLATDILRPTFNIFTLLYIVRITMTWYPNIDGKKFPWALAYVPTEPILSVTRKIVPLVSGVDVSPIVWVGLISFLSEILLGPQGILTLIQARGGV